MCESRTTAKSHAHGMIWKFAIIILKTAAGKIKHGTFSQSHALHFYTHASDTTAFLFIQRIRIQPDLM